MKRMPAHSHHHGNAGFTDTERGIRVLKVSLWVLGLTAGMQAVADLCIAVSPPISVAEAHRITEDVRHELLHHFSALVDVTIHADPYTGESSDPFHDLTAHHFQNVEKA